MDKNAKHYPLNVTMPQHCAYVVRDLPQATVEQRERALNATHWNEFAFPSGMLTVDMLSDSGTTAMTNQQWATLFLGDEAYGRNTGYYVLLDTFRDIFERGGEKNWKKVIDLVRTDCRDLEKMMDELFFNYSCIYVGGQALTIGKFGKEFTSTDHPHTRMLSIHTHSDHFFYFRHQLMYD